MADYLGDPTPRSLGRLTLNPLAHLDPLGTLVILVTGAFGWGKPSPFDPYNLKDVRRDTALIALAGPVSNILLAIALSFLHRILPVQLTTISYMLIALNINLALFNLLPIPPLDGSKIFTTSWTNPRNSQMGYLLLIFLLMSGLITTILSPVSSFILNLLI